MVAIHEDRPCSIELVGALLDLAQGDVLLSADATERMLPTLSAIEERGRSRRLKEVTPLFDAHLPQRVPRIVHVWAVQSKQNDPV